MPKTCTSCNATYPDEMVFCPTDGTSLRLDEAEGELIGTVIADRYLVNKLLGEGGMGRVYLARHVRLPQQAAIKVLHQDMVKDAGAVARFNREAANAARIEHDRVARVFDFGETTDGLVYIAMEFVPGVTLRNLLDTERRLSAVRAANLIYQVAEGLDAAHRLSIVHRDLKPDNILVVTDENGTDRCKVVDFGIAKVTNGSETQLTQVGMLVGTPEFMSPEQVLGEQLDGRSDVYALALVAYEMLSGGLPFEGNTPERKLTARLIQDPKPLADIAPDVSWPAELQMAFDNALVREPENRTSTALEFADAVVNAVEAWTGMSVLRPRTPMSTPAILAAANESTAARSQPTPPMGSAAVGTSKVASPAPAPPRMATPGASTSASKAAIPEPVAKPKPIAAIAAVVLLVVAVGGYFAFGRSSSTDVAAADGGAGTTVDAPAVADAGSQSPAANGTPAANPAGASTTAPPTGAGSSSSGATTAAPRPGTPNVPATAANPANVNNGSNGAPSAAPTTPATSTANAADAALAQRELQAIRSAIQGAPDGQDVVVGLKAIGQLLPLFPRFNNATDSVWAYETLATAYAMSDQQEKSCQPLRQGRRMATSAAQRTAIDGLFNALTCAP